jgi:hypothetical protein
MVTVDREATARFLGHETWFRILGEVPGDPDGPAPLVTVHGGPGGTHDYLLSLSDLASGGRAVVFYDQLGNGNSTHLAEAPSEFWTFELFLAELDNLLAHLDIASRYHLLGQSWGGIPRSRARRATSPGPAFARTVEHRRVLPRLGERDRPAAGRPAGGGRGDASLL